MDEDFAHRPPVPGATDVSSTARGWTEVRSKIQNYMVPLWDCRRARSKALRGGRGPMSAGSGGSGPSESRPRELDVGQCIRLGERAALQQLPESFDADLGGTALHKAPRRPDHRSLDVPSEGDRRVTTGRPYAKQHYDSSDQNRRGEAASKAAAEGRGEGPRAPLRHQAMTPVPADEPRTNSVQVPGASASTVSSVCLWSSMPRWLLSSSLPLASFLRSLLSDVPAQEIPGTSPWPMPLPYPLVMKKGKIRTPRRRRALCIIVNLMTAALSFLACGRPSAPPPEVRGGKLSGEQRGIVRRLEAWAKVLVELRIDCVTMGRAAAKVESMEKQVRALERVSAELLQNSAAGYGRPLKRRPATSSSHYKNFREFSGEIQGSEDPPRFLDKGDEVVAKSIEVSRVQLKGQPSFCPLPYLDAESASHYQDPWRWMLSPAEVVDRPPRTRVFARPNEKMKLFSLLDQGKRLAIFDAEIALPDYSNGLFAVIKNQTKDRLVLDGRPPNSLERPTGAFLRSMACASALLPLFIPPTKVAVFAGEDISDYYYRFKVSRARSRRNILVRTVPRPICEQFQAFTDKALPHLYHSKHLCCVTTQSCHGRPQRGDLRPDCSRRATCLPLRSRKGRAAVFRLLAA